MCFISVHAKINRKTENLSFKSHFFHFSSYLVKLVQTRLSCWGCPSAEMFSFLIIHAMFRPSVRMVCNPSSSCAA